MFSEWELSPLGPAGLPFQLDLPVTQSGIRQMCGANSITAETAETVGFGRESNTLAGEGEQVGVNRLHLPVRSDAPRAKN